MNSGSKSEPDLSPQTPDRLLTVLDKGYVRLVDVMGSDLSVVNAARVSFHKDSAEFSKQDARLLNYLAKHGHTSPFRHAFVSFEVKAPLFVARQWWKYVVGSDHTMDGWNEVSRRYVTEAPEFYIPEAWRKQAESKKQGSEGRVSDDLSEHLTGMLQRFTGSAAALYTQALEQEVAVEQARLFLPAYAMYTTWRWSASLQSVFHFLAQRLDDDAQAEIRQYAQAVVALSQPLFPESFAAMQPTG